MLWKWTNSRGIQYIEKELLGRAKARAWRGNTPSIGRPLEIFDEFSEKVSEKKLLQSFFSRPRDGDTVSPRIPAMALPKGEGDPVMFR